MTEQAYVFIRPYRAYSPGDVISPTPGVADLLMQRQLVKPVGAEPKRRGRPRKAGK